ncbi:MAG: hypothetical protein DRR19_10435 [Candidatus Parabeggiatoa sp. nov. 1]|nr:MAG: hypothetical protein DRR19_10435 [Gammaproteobacteria bacterium]
MVRLFSNLHLIMFLVIKAFKSGPIWALIFKQSKLPITTSQLSRFEHFYWFVGTTLFFITIQALICILSSQINQEVFTIWCIK